MDLDTLARTVLAHTPDHVESDSRHFGPLGPEICKDIVGTKRFSLQSYNSALVVGQYAFAQSLRCTI